MPKVTMTILGASVEIEDDNSTSTALANLAMKKLKEAAAIPSGSKNTMVGGGPGFHTDALPASKPEPYAVPFTVHPDAHRRHS